MAKVLVIGAASLDVLRLADGRVMEAPGGAGLYTALAAARSGAEATLLAPRPNPVPALLAPVVQIVRWLGPRVPISELPRLEIAQHGQGRATLIDARWGALDSLAAADLPEDGPAYDVIHVAALRSAQRQLDFLQACQKRGVRLLSAGTYARSVYGETDLARALCQQANLFFLNENEANGLFGSLDAARAAPGQRLFVTCGERGVVVIDEQRAVQVPARPAKEVDATGAGDTFCGAVLAGLARGEGVIPAAQAAVELAARVVEQAGPAALIAG